MSDGSRTAAFLSERLKQLRERHAITQESLAQMSGISYKYYQDIEGGRQRNLRLSTIEKLAGVFQLEGYELFYRVLPATKLKKVIQVDAPHLRRRVVKKTEDI